MRMFNGREFVDVEYVPKQDYTTEKEVTNHNGRSVSGKSIASSSIPSEIVIVFDNSGPSYKSPKHLPAERPKEKVTEMRP